MAVSPLAGKPADPSSLVNVPRLVTAYYTGRPDPAVPAQRVSFGTSGHRGSSFDVAFNEAHILATTEAICRHRAQERHRRTAVHRDRHPRALGARVRQRARGPGGARRRGDDRRQRRLHADARRLARHPHLQPRAQRRARGRHRDHAVPQPARPTAASSTTRRTADRPTPAVTGWIQEQANALLAEDLRGVRRIPYERARAAATTHTARLPERLRRRPRRGGRSRGGARRDDLARRRSARRRQRRLLGRHRRALRARARGGEPRGGSHVPLHDGRLGRQDPHGSVVALGDGAHGRS